MTRYISFAVLMAGVCLLSAEGAAADPAVWTRKAGRTWTDGMFVGNGSHGVMAYAPGGLEWTINRNDLFDSHVGKCDLIPHAEVMRRLDSGEEKNSFFIGKAETAGLSIFQPDTVSAAILKIRFWGGIGWAAPSMPLVTQTLDTRTGELAETLRSTAFDIKVTTIVPRSDDIVAIRIENAWGFVVDLTRPADVRLADSPDWKWAEGVLSFVQTAPGGEKYAVAFALKSARKSVFKEPGPLVRRLESGGETELFIAVRAFNEKGDARAAAVAAVRAAQAKGYASLSAANRAWWADFWAKGGDARFPEQPEIERNWRFSLYALASSFGRAPMPGLNGLSYGPIDAANPGVGSQGYMHDQNVQIPMVPFPMLGHPGFLESMADTYLSVADVIRTETSALFGTDGMSLPICMNQAGRMIDGGEFRYSLEGSAYSGAVMALAWRFSRDRKYLEKIYPLLDEFAAFYLGIMKIGADGRYHLDWSVPPEIFSFTRDELSCLAGLKTCLETLVEASRILGRGADKRAKWQDVLAHYPELSKTKEGGWWCGPDIPGDHYMWAGHLFYPFFPCEADVDTVAAAKTVAWTLDRGYEISWQTGDPRPLHDWSAFYFGVTRIRLGDREAGWRGVADYLRDFGKPNGLFSHNPVIVTNLTAAEARANLAKVPKVQIRRADGRYDVLHRGSWADCVTPDPEAKALAPSVVEAGATFLELASETLLQSWGGKVRIFPCVPADFTGSFERFRAQGGFTVSAAMEKGRVVAFLITAQEDADLDLVAPHDASFKTIHRHLKAGESIVQNAEP